MVRVSCSRIGFEHTASSESDYERVDVTVSQVLKPATYTISEQVRTSEPMGLICHVKEFDKFNLCWWSYWI